MFKKITSSKNIREAYQEVFDYFHLENKENRYRGLDGLNLNFFNLFVFNLIRQIKKEMREFKEIDPALNIYIPKKHNPEKNREIFIYNIKERVKSQAIYRVLLGEFEKEFSSRLFSYRPGKSPYNAAYLMAKRYRKFFNTDYVFTADLSNFSGEIDRTLMMEKLSEFIKDDSVLKLLSVFVNNSFYYQGEFLKPNRGLVIGCPIFGLLTNFYLNDIDKKFSSRAQFYLRVGDDLIMLDPDKEKLEKNKEEFLNDVSNLKLKINLDKIFFGQAKEKFSYLGYNFLAGKISLPDNFVKKIIKSWQSILIYKNYSQNYKMTILRKIMKNPQKNFNNVFKGIIKSKPQINDSDQIKLLSESFFKVLTEFLFGKYNSRNRRLLVDKLSESQIKIISLYKFYLKFHYDRK
ncbi:MAG TPA: reverse transcriptase domain-containing protein [bacterium]|nr:reverse transcriptase domain-containing protein [bacterium]HPV65438.1 reverse transcriptase domain-containing protein [bacterium]